MRLHDDEDAGIFTRRALILGGLGALSFSALAARLYKLQILQSDRYRGLSEDNQFNFRLLVPSRGKILDRYGKVLADNRDNYRLLLNPDQVGDLDALLDTLAGIIPLSQDRRDKIKKAIAKRRPFSSVTLAEQLSWNDFAAVNLHLPDMPGVRPDIGELREYPYKEVLAHLVGYVGKVPEGMQSDDPLLQYPGFRIGRSGVEKSSDAVLRGKAGALKVEVNALGRVIRELPDPATAAQAGQDLALTLDVDIQRYAASRLEGQSAAVCALDVRNGDVLALASVPSFDPNLFARGIPEKTYKALLNNDHKPLFNKAIGGVYSPASCFKPVVAMAALHHGVTDGRERVRCTGKIKLGDREFHCWNRRGHGPVNMLGAIGVSCDIYFYEMARRLGIEKIHDNARLFGFGDRFDLGLGGARRGLVPNAAWKRARFELPWSQGETLITGIGQGFISATPLQLAVMTARMATGRKVTPRLLQGEPQEDFAPLDYNEGQFGAVRAGMIAVCETSWGTAHRLGGLGIKGVQMAGKSGTGQVRRISKQERDTRVLKNHELPWKMRDHALFVAYAPAVQPRYAVSVIVEHGGGGSSVAAPPARDILRALVEKERSSLAASASAPARGVL